MIFRTRLSLSMDNWGRGRFIHSQPPFLKFPSLVCTTTPYRSLSTSGTVLSKENPKEVGPPKSQTSSLSTTVPSTLTPSFVLTFPGQGSQRPGMGKDLYDSFSIARYTFQEMDEALQQSLSKIMFTGTDTKNEQVLNSTVNTQPALFTHSLAVFRVLQHELGNEFFPTYSKYVMGHSVGEYGALAVAGSLVPSEAVQLLRLRGKSMQAEVDDPTKYGMTALLLGTNPNKGIVPISSSTNSHKESTVRSVLKTVELLREHYQQQQQALQASSNSTIFSIAGINSPQQIVVSGHTNTLSSVIHSFTNQFAASSPLLIKRSVKLNVSAPFHSSLFTATPKHISQALIVDGKEDTSNTLRARIVSPTIPYIANIHGNSLQQPNDIKDALVQNITSPVRWLESLHTVVHQTMESKINSSLLFLELGTGNTLTGLLKQTFPSTTATLPQPMNENTDKPSSGTSIPSISGRSIGTVKEIQEFVQLIEQSLR